ncbi:MAG: hydrogenase maturation protease [Candidatus Lokiarchaeota archaeon]|nr:hydrogenase maturation protease [Candidatus Lokiarchaeota archaeon]
MDEFYDKLFKRLNYAIKIVFLGIGEEKLQDDGVGPYIITKLLNKKNQRFLFINAGVDPMSRINDIIDFCPSHLIILDTCNLKDEPGTVAIIERKNMEALVSISTHTLPIHVVIDYLLKKIPNLDSFMIGFVPKSLDGFKELNLFKDGELTIEEINENEDLPFFQFQLTDILKETADKVIDIIKELINII